METFDNKDNFIAAVEEAKQRLAAGEKPENVFDLCLNYYEGFTAVKLDDKWNYINNKGKLISDVWFDRCYDFYDGFACVVVNGKGNYIDCNGKLLSDTGFDDCGFFYGRFAAVRLNGKWNFINREGKYLSDTWFDDCDNFHDGFAPVGLNGIDYLLRNDGLLCDKNTKEPIKPPHSVSPDIDYKKKYEEALQMARVVNPGTADHNIVTAIFPELAESEDEKIRKRIIKVFSGEIGLPTKEEVNKYIAWLEKQVEPTDKGEISDGYHTFNELYYYRMLYNAAFFNLLPKEWVHKSKRHHTGEECFGGGWFIVMAQLPTGQISNHYELKDWDLFHVQEKEIADEWDGHSPQEAADRLHKYLLEKQGEQKLTAWSKEDESMYIRTLGILGTCYIGELPTKVEEEFYWLKSIKERYTWKPDNEQMEALNDAVRLYKSTHFDSQHHKIESLYEDLKKLKNE